MRCLVTGASGFIGGTLVQRLATEGHQVRGVIHHTQPSFSHANLEYVTGDIADPEFLESIMDHVEVVFHCAAMVKDYGPKKEFHRINVEATQHLATLCQIHGVRRFIFLSHIHYESQQRIAEYQKTKALAEHYLLKKYAEEQFPVVIIRPGNVYGPGATTWVLRLLRAIQNNRIALVDHGKGIFLHTYIDNLLDAIMIAVDKPGVLGKTIDITDGDNTVTWGDYINALAKMAHKPPIQKNLSKSTALVISKMMMALYTLFRVEPWVTPYAVEIFTNHHTVSIEAAKDLLGYTPKISLSEGLRHVEHWLKTEGYITEDHE
ncbi:MAG TPA: NAD(P)-dependent oxidoreductase [Candidatus Thermoplasmatota archaeon]|nr:NAD(P)-dependent oxidoreductase [Candidatus Thermoplasmatota archaeon]